MSIRKGHHASLRCLVVCGTLEQRFTRSKIRPVFQRTYERRHISVFWWWLTYAGRHRWREKNMTYSFAGFLLSLTLKTLKWMVERNIPDQLLRVAYAKFPKLHEARRSPCAFPGFVFFPLPRPLGYRWRWQGLERRRA